MYRGCIRPVRWGQVFQKHKVAATVTDGDQKTRRDCLTRSQGEFDKGKKKKVSCREELDRRKLLRQFWNGALSDLRRPSRRSSVQPFPGWALWKTPVFRRPGGRSRPETGQRKVGASAKSRRWKHLCGLSNLTEMSRSCKSCLLSEESFSAIVWFSELGNDLLFCHF